MYLVTPLVSLTVICPLVLVGTALGGVQRMRHGNDRPRIGGRGNHTLMRVPARWGCSWAGGCWCRARRWSHRPRRCGCRRPGPGRAPGWEAARWARSGAAAAGGAAGPCREQEIVGESFGVAVGIGHGQRDRLTDGRRRGTAPDERQSVSAGSRDIGAVSIRSEVSQWYELTVVPLHLRPQVHMGAPGAELGHAREESLTVVNINYI